MTRIRISDLLVSNICQPLHKSIKSESSMFLPMFVRTFSGVVSSEYTSLGILEYSLDGFGAQTDTDRHITTDLIIRLISSKLTL